MTARRLSFALTVLGPLVLTACPDPGSEGILTTATTIPTTTTATTTATTDETGTSGTDPSGDGDGDPSGDGDGDPSGDGDGDPSGDGDGDPSGDGDGDPSDTDNPGCEDGDSGDEPWAPEPPLAPPLSEDPQPHGPNFVPQEDIPVSECEIFQQDCPDGEKCVPYASMGGNWDANKCVVVTGDGMVGEACSFGGVVEATDDCDENTFCWDVDDEAMGTCTEFCGGTPQAPECPAGTTCLTGSDGAIALCVQSCNPITQNCEPGTACYWTNNGFTCVFTTQDIPTGEPCGFINDCDTGNACLTASVVPDCAGNACCAEFCDTDCGANTCSQPGTECVPYFEQGQAPFGQADVGVCILP